MLLNYDENGCAKKLVSGETTGISILYERSLSFARNLTKSNKPSITN